ncbi:metallophosphoesterase [Tropicimonas sp.]|uniref:metallophosphoesterase n=1 Tax=Tropicimonas sp. TaxID=2067044 RepID=UPI003A876D59
MRSYAIGDIHGQLGRLKEAHDRIATDKARCGDPDAPVLHLGDLVDRGPDARGVIDYLLARARAGEHDIVLLGNHDQMMRDFLVPQRWYARGDQTGRWLQPGIGGRETLRSYGVDVSLARRSRAIRKDALEAVPQSHRAFLCRRPTSHFVGEVFFCHAGVRPGVALNRQEERDLLWIRDEFLFDTGDHGALIVHGHTPVEAVTHYGNRLNIDTGAGYDGPLSAVVIEGREVWLLTGSGRLPVAPGALAPF